MYPGRQSVSRQTLLYRQRPDHLQKVAEHAIDGTSTSSLAIASFPLPASPEIVKVFSGDGSTTLVTTFDFQGVKELSDSAQMYYKEHKTYAAIVNGGGRPPPVSPEMHSGSLAHPC